MGQAGPAHRLGLPGYAVSDGIESRKLAPSQRPGLNRDAHYKRSGDLQPSIFVSCAKEVPQEPRLKVVTAYYDLAQADNRLIVEWLLQCRPARSASMMHSVRELFFGNAFRALDIRYNLAELLQSKAVRQEFDVIIIDCPPRLTTGAVQALCAGSHLLIPTILDQASAEAVVAFAEEIEGLKAGDVCSHIKYVGIVGTKVSSNVDRIAERDAKLLISDALRDKNVSLGLIADSEFIRQSTSLVNNADEGIAYLVGGNNPAQQEARQGIARLGEYVARHIGLPPQPAFQTSTTQGN